jgi:PurA ssDNA and RNA-binding protein
MKHFCRHLFSMTEGCFFQVKANFRTAITIPEKSWGRFRDIFDEYVEKMKDAEVENLLKNLIFCVTDDAD